MSSLRFVVTVVVVKERRGFGGGERKTQGLNKSEMIFGGEGRLFFLQYVTLLNLYVSPFFRSSYFAIFLFSLFHFFLFPLVSPLLPLFISLSVSVSSSFFFPPSFLPSVFSLVLLSFLLPSRVAPTPKKTRFDDKLIKHCCHL